MAFPCRTTVTRSKGSRCHGMVSPGARRMRRTSVDPRLKRTSSDISTSILDSILDLPGLVEHVPCDAAHKITRFPAHATAWATLCYFTVCRGSQSIQDCFAGAFQFLAELCRLILHYLPAQA